MTPHEILKDWNMSLAMGNKLFIDKSVSVAVIYNIYIYIIYIYIYIYRLIFINKKNVIDACCVLTSFWDYLKYSMLHCYFYLFLKFPCILFLFQAESVKGQFDAMANGAILAEELKNEGGLGWRVKKRVGSGSSCLRFLFVAPLLLTCRLFISLHFTD